jgi:hypothetical protein
MNIATKFIKTTPKLFYNTSRIKHFSTQNYTYKSNENKEECTCNKSNNKSNNKSIILNIVSDICITSILLSIVGGFVGVDKIYDTYKRYKVDDLQFMKQKLEIQNAYKKN